MQFDRREFGLLSFSRNREYLMPAPKGYESFSGVGFACAPPAKRPYAQSPALRRRLEVGAILLTTLAAGIEPACDQVDPLSRQPVFLPSFVLRSVAGNLMNAARSASFGHWGDTGLASFCSEWFFINKSSYWRWDESRFVFS